MYRVNDDGSESFGYTRYFKWVTAYCFLFSAALVVVSVLGLTIGSKPAGAAERRISIGVMLVSGTMFGSLALWIVPTIRRLGDRFRVSASGIRCESGALAGAEIQWHELASLRDRPVLQRLELRTLGAGLTLRLENQLENFDRLRAIVMQQTDWRSLVEGPEGRILLPISLKVMWPVWPSLLVLVALCTASSLLMGRPEPRFVGPLIGMILVLVILPLVVWRSVHVETDKLVLKGVFRRKVIPVAELDSVCLRNSDKKGFGYVMLRIHVKASAPITFFQVQGGVLSLLAALTMMSEGEHQISVQNETQEW